ncbi:MAG: hypothetical protein R3348_07220 [Xanthomonadales bacterium]|nr:hypothetical protein [Xanthomonadales bacterium]
MSKQPVHRFYRHFREVPLSLRALFTGTLLVVGMGYLFALVYVYYSHAGLDGEPAVSVQDIAIAYGGSGEASVLESALRSSMSDMADEAAMRELLEWLHGGGDRETYETTVRPIIESNCIACHDGSDPHLSNLDGFDNIRKVTATDTGADVFTLVRVSHIHLFGLTFIFFVVGFIFSHAYMRPVWLKCTIILTPFLCVLADVSSWYLTKLSSGFAWVVLVAGGLMAFSFAVMWFVSIYQMWFAKMPEDLVNRATSDHG